MKKVVFYLLVTGAFIFGLVRPVSAITLSDLTMYQLEAENANYYAYLETQKAVYDGKIKTDCDATIFYDQKVVEYLAKENALKDKDTAQKLQNIIGKVYQKFVCNPDGTINVEKHRKFTLELSKYLEKQIKDNFEKIKDYNDLINFVIKSMYKFYQSKLSS
jgi:hypothetical protein